MFLSARWPSYPSYPVAPDCSDSRRPAAQTESGDVVSKLDQRPAAIFRGEEEAKSPEVLQVLLPVGSELPGQHHRGVGNLLHDEEVVAHLIFAPDTIVEGQG